MDINVNDVREKAAALMNELLDKAELPPRSVVVLGCSSSEICGGHIGKASSEEVGAAVISGILPIVRANGLFLAVQGCEHINRVLVIEEEAALLYNFEQVTVVPALHAGGACSLAMFKQCRKPVMVERVVARAGLDIGDTFIGMHIKHVAVPIRLAIKELYGAHVTACKSRPKLIGGERAKYILDI